MAEKKTQDPQYYDNFRYKSYDEIMLEKKKHRAVRRGMFIAAVFFVALTTLVTCIGILIGSTPLKLFSSLASQQGEPNPGGTTQVTQDGTHTQGESENDDFTLEITQPNQDDSAAIYAKDVSGVVKKTRMSVVGVTSETYDNYQSSVKCGSGIIMSADGYIITNNHVIDGGNSITVTLDDGTECAAYTIGSDPYTDLAVLKIEQSGLKAAEFGDSDDSAVGDIAIAIGNPTGQLQGTATCGIISALNRNVEINNTVMNLIQTDAAINSGNSGGPLLNQYGQVIGITSAKVSMSGYEGLGFAIPINTAKPIVEALVQSGYVSGRPLLGVQGSDLSKMAASFYGVPQGIYVQAVSSDSDAAGKGLKSGDIITGLNGEAVTTISTGCTVRNEQQPGDLITVTVFRRGTGTFTLQIQLMEQTNETGDYNF